MEENIIFAENLAGNLDHLLQNGYLFPQYEIDRLKFLLEQSLSLLSEMTSIEQFKLNTKNK